VRSERYLTQPGDYQQCKPVVQAPEWANPGSSVRAHHNEVKRVGFLPGVGCEHSSGDVAVTTNHSTVALENSQQQMRKRLLNITRTGKYM